ncbi:MAG TPA: histidine kinase [Gemmatimonadaceae bacterium]|nr:histidine kinase [Gemmatimonadaceae bacterium]
MTVRPVESADDALQQLIDWHRSRAERLLNGVRALVLVLLAAAAFAYAPALPLQLTWVNVIVLAITLTWTFAQWAMFYRRERLPGWLALVNPAVDVTAITVVMAEYGISQSAKLALGSPMLLAYFAILASRPITSSTRKSAAVAALVVAEYSALLAFFVVTGRARIVGSPIEASVGEGVAWLDEGAKILLLAVGGAIATYVTAWYERLLTSYHMQARARERLEARLARAQLEALELQLHPHFLFNTLNAITALIAQEPRSAERIVSGLSELLRFSLSRAGEQEVTVERELDLLGRYIDIQVVRFPDRLRVDLDVDPDVMTALVPSMILQPLVENAIRHGIAPRAAGGRVEVRAEREGDTLRLTVRDDGLGSAAKGSVDGRGGVGLANTRARLQHLYGEQQEMRAGPLESGGYLVAIGIPFHTATVAVTADEVAS